MKRSFEAPSIPTGAQRSKLEVRKPKLPKAETEKTDRARMCESLMHSAEQLATLGAFLAGANGIAGCATFERQESQMVRRLLHGDDRRSHESGSPSQEEMSEELLLQTGHVASDLEGQHRRFLVAHGAESERNRPTVFEGFREHGINAEQIQEYVRSAFPRGWQNAANVGTVRLDPRLVAMDYPGYEHEAESAHCFVYHDGRPSEIVITRERTKTAPDETVDMLLDRVLAHEYSHANDWSSSPDLSPELSLEMRYAVLKLSTDPGRPKFTYIEKIQSAHSDTKLQTERRMTEYFPVLISTAFSMRKATDMRSWDWSRWKSEVAQMLSSEFEASTDQGAKNAEFVHWYLAKIDPDFKPWVAAEESFRVKEKIDETFEATRIERALDKAIPDVTLQRAMRSALDVPAADFSVQDLAWQESEFALRHQKGRDDQAKSMDADFALDAWNQMAWYLSDIRLSRWKHVPTEGVGKNFLGVAKLFAVKWALLDPEERNRLRPKMLGRIALLVSHAPPEQK